MEAKHFPFSVTCFDRRGNRVRATQLFKSHGKACKYMSELIATEPDAYRIAVSHWDAMSRELTELDSWSRSSAARV